jgi:hypothetical protein
VTGSVKFASPLEGEVGPKVRVGGDGAAFSLLSALKCLTDKQQHPFSIAQHVVIPESDNAISASLEPFGADTVVIGMLTAIDLDDQLSFRAEEIGDVRSDWVLSPETSSVQLLAPQTEPQSLLSIGEIATQFAGERRSHSFNFGSETAATLPPTRRCFASPTSPSRGEATDKTLH